MWESSIKVLAPIEKSVSDPMVAGCLKIVIDDKTAEDIFTEAVPIEESCQEGDYVVCSFDGNRNAIAIGKGYFGCDFETALIGMKAGEMRNIQVNAGESTDVKMISVKRKMIPEVIADYDGKINRYIENEKKRRMIELPEHVSNYMIANSVFGDYSATREKFAKENLDYPEEMRMQEDDIEKISKYYELSMAMAEDNGVELSDDDWMIEAMNMQKRVFGEYFKDKFTVCIDLERSGNGHM